MSELKATTAQEIVREEKDCDYMDELFGGVKMPPTQVYIKSETDKVIAELEESHKKEVEKLLIEIVKLKDIDSKNRSAYYKDLAMMAKDVEHHKYKRCLAMAKWCRARYNEWVAYYPTTTTRKMRFLDKWEKRWLTLADKYKEGNV